MKLLATLLLAVSLVPQAQAFNCESRYLDELVAKEFIRFFECGGQVNGGKGECLSQSNFDYIVTRLLAPQSAGYNEFKVRDSDTFKFISVEKDVVNSNESMGIDVRKVTFEHQRGKLITRFTFLYDMQLPATQRSYGCAVMRTSPENRGREYVFLGKPSLRN